MLSYRTWPSGMHAAMHVEPRMLCTTEWCVAGSSLLILQCWQLHNADKYACDECLPCCYNQCLSPNFTVVS